MANLRLPRLARRTVIATTLAAAACLAAGPGDVRPDPATLPWAVRAIPGGALLLLLEHSNVGVSVPATMRCGQIVGGPPIVIDAHGMWYGLSATPMELPATRPAAGEQPAKVDAPTLDQLTIALRPMAMVPTPGSLVVDAAGSLGYRVRCTCANCHGVKSTVIDAGRLVAGQRVDCLVAVGSDAPAAIADAESTAALLLGRAKAFQRRAVVNHAELPDGTAVPTTHAPTASPTPMPAPAPSTPAMGNTPGITPAVARLNAHAATALAAAQKLQADGKDVPAYEHFRYVLTQYPKTPAAVTAATAVAAYESDADFMAHYKAKPTDAPQPTSRPAAPPAMPADRADALLQLADQYITTGHANLARAKYQQVIDRYPNSTAATEARKRLAKLAGE